MMHFRHRKRFLWSSAGYCSGPLLFNIYANWYLRNFNLCQIPFLADDAVYYVSAKTVEAIVNVMNTELMWIHGEYAALKLEINLSKSKAMIFRGGGEASQL